MQGIAEKVGQTSVNLFLKREDSFTLQGEAYTGLFVPK